MTTQWVLEKHSANFFSIAHYGAHCRREEKSKLYAYCNNNAQLNTSILMRREQQQFNICVTKTEVSGSDATMYTCT